MNEKILQEFVLPGVIAGEMSSSSATKKTCLCAPTNHAGSFRCRLHRTSQKRSLPKQLPSPREDFDVEEPRFTSTKKTPIGKFISRFRSPENSTRGLMPFGKPQLSCHRSRNLPRPSRLSKVTFACDVKEEEGIRNQLETFSIGQPDFSKPFISAHSSPSVRLFAVNKFENAMAKDVLRTTNLETGSHRPIFSR